MSSTVDIIIRGRNDVKPALDGARSAVQSFAAGTLGDFRRVSGAVFNLRNVIAGAAAGGALKMVISPAIEMETYRTQFEVLLGSTDAARERLEGLAEFAATTPFELPGIVRASKLLQTLTGGAFADAAALRMVGDAASASNRPIEEMATWFGRLYDGIRNNREVGEAMMRLQELGVISGEARGKIEALKKANASSTEVWAEVVKAMARYEGMTERVSQTTAGRLSTMRDNFTELKRIVGESMLPSLNAAIEDTIKAIEGLRDSGALQQFGTEAGEVLTGLWEALRDTTIWLVQHKDAVRTTAEAYVAFRVITATAESLAALMATVRALEAAHYGAATAATAHAAAEARVVPSATAATAAVVGLETATTRATVVAGLLRAGLMALGPQVVAVGVAGIVAEIFAIKRACDDANEALAALGMKGGNSYWETAKTVAKAWSPAYQVGRYVYEKFAGPREVFRSEAPTDAELAAARKQRDAAMGPKPPAAPGADMGGGESDAAAKKAAEERLKAARDIAAAAKKELDRRSDLRRRLNEAEKALATETVDSAVEREEIEGHRRALALKGTTDEYIAALQRYSERVEAARKDIDEAETESAKRAAERRLSQAKRLAEAEASALGEHAAGLRAEAARLDEEARIATAQLAGLRDLAMNPRLARDTARETRRTERSAARDEARMERRIEDLRERGMTRDGEGVWRDRFGRAASTSGQAALEYDEARRRSGISEAAQAKRDEAETAEREIAQSRETLSAATVDLSGNVAALRDEIAALTAELAGKDGEAGEFEGLGDFDLAGLSAGAQALVDAADLAATTLRQALKDALIAQGVPVEGSGTPGTAGNAPVEGGGNVGGGVGAGANRMGWAPGVFTDGGKAGVQVPDAGGAMGGESVVGLLTQILGESRSHTASLSALTRMTGVS